MKEELLHYIWKTKRFDLSKLTTTCGKPIELIQSGIHNTNAGPDFLNARIKIGDTLWAGNVEIHVKASHWKQHRHGKDKAYDNVILHVVWEEDLWIQRISGTKIVCLELEGRVSPKLIQQYERIAHQTNWIPCQNLIKEVSYFDKVFWLERLAVERLSEKTERIKLRLDQNKGDWEETFYQVLATQFGLSVNTQPFEQLARSIPLKLLERYTDRLFQLEALIFGQAGYLQENYEEAYPNRLKKEFTHLQKKYNLTPIPVQSWKFARLRPANFPTVRLAQFAGLIFSTRHLFSKMLAINELVEIENMLQIQVSPYWMDHYRFDKQSIKRKKLLGKSTIQLIAINAFIPMLFLYGQQKQLAAFKDKALQLLDAIPPEKNSIIRNWEQLDFKPATALQSQGLLQLKNHYCEKGRCLECVIGSQLMSKV